MLCLSVCCGCGTYATRSRDHSFGAYPYAAVAADMDMFYLGDGSTLNTSCGDLAFIISSIVGDFVLDTVLLPLDLGCWAFGAHKRALD